MSTGGGPSITVANLVATLGVNDNNLAGQMRTAQAALSQVERQMDQLNAAHERGTVVGMQYLNRLVDLQTAQTQLGGIIANITTRTNALADANMRVQVSMNGLGAAIGRSGAAALQFGYMIDDLQYGFSAIVNNIPGLLMGMGYGPGLAGVLGIAAVATSQLVKHWGDLTNYLGMTAVQTAAEHMDALAKNTHKTAEETRELSRLKKEQHDIDAMLEKRPEAMEKSEKAARAAMGEADIKTLIETMKAARNPKGVPMTAEEEAAIAFKKTFVEAGQQPGAGLVGEADARRNQKEIDAIRRGAEQRENERINADINRGLANLGGAAGEKLMAEIGKLPQAGVKAGLLGDLRNATPEAMTQQAEWEAAGKLYDENWKRRQTEEKAAASKEATDRKTATDAEAKMFDDAATKLSDAMRKGGTMIGLGPEKKADLVAVYAELQRVLGVEGAAKFGEAVKNRLLKSGQEAMQEKQLREHLTPAQAQKAMFDEIRDKQKREEDAKRNRAAAEVRERMPGVDLMAQQGLIAGRLAGKGEDVTAKAMENGLKAAFKARGMNPEDAGRAAAEITKDANRKLDERLMKEQVSPHNRPLISETVDLRSFQAKVQAGIGGGDIPSRQLREQQITNSLLATKFAEDRQKRRFILPMG